MAIHNHDTGVLTPPQAFSKNMDCYQSAKKNGTWRDATCREVAADAFFVRGNRSGSVVCPGTPCV